MGLGPAIGVKLNTAPGFDDFKRNAPPKTKLLFNNTIIKILRTGRFPEQGTGSREQGAGSREQGARSEKHGARSKEQGAGSMEQEAGSKSFTLRSSRFSPHLCRLPDPFSMMSISDPNLSMLEYFTRSEATLGSDPSAEGGNDGGDRLRLPDVRNGY